MTEKTANGQGFYTDTDEWIAKYFSEDSVLAAPSISPRNILVTEGKSSESYSSSSSSSSISDYRIKLPLQQQNQIPPFQKEFSRPVTVIEYLPGQPLSSSTLPSILDRNLEPIGQTFMVRRISSRDSSVISRRNSESSETSEGKKTRKRFSVDDVSPLNYYTDDIEEMRSKSTKSQLIKHLFPSDIRLSYHRIIVDAFNTGSNQHLERCLQSFCATNCKMLSYHYGRNVYQHRELTGAKNISAFFNMFHDAIPDAVMSVNGFYIKKFATIPDNFSKYLTRKSNAQLSSRALDPSDAADNVVFFIPCSFTGTRVSDVVTEQRSVISHHSGSLESSIVITEEISAENSEHTTKISLSHLRAPVIVKSTGYWVIVLNSENRMSRIEFHMKS